MPASALERLRAALAEAAGTHLALERPADAAHGDYATNAALRLAGQRRRPPRELAQELAAAAAALPQVERAEVAGPGFVNVHVSDAFLLEALDEVLAAGGRYGAGRPERRERVQVEFVSANPTGPLTVGSARNGAYGDAVARLLEFAGHEVEREYYFNDAGGQIERFRASVEARRRGEEPPEDGYHGAYVSTLAELDEDPLPVMLRRIEESLERFRIHYDTWVRQSAIEAEIPLALADVDTYEADGATWARTSAYGDEKDWVVVRSTGEPSYFAADIAYMRDKLARGFDRLVYVLGADHHGYVGRLKALAAMLGRDPETVEVLLYQLVHLTSGGEATKMSKRRGDVVTLDELIDEVGVDAARWFLVNRGPDQTIEIDVDLAGERSQKNPVYYVQYVHARTAGVFREAGPQARVGGPPPGPLDREERDLVKRLLEFPEVAAEAAARRAPQGITTYAIRVADDFHRFYHDRDRHRIVGSDAQDFRLGLARATQLVVARALDLVGVGAPERM